MNQFMLSQSKHFFKCIQKFEDMSSKILLNGMQYFYVVFLVFFCQYTDTSISLYVLLRTVSSLCNRTERFLLKMNVTKACCIVKHPHPLPPTPVTYKHIKCKYISYSSCILYIRMLNTLPNIVCDRFAHKKSTGTILMTMYEADDKVVN